MDSQTTLKQPTRSRKLLVDMPAIIAKKKKATPVSRLRRALHQRLRQVPAQGCRRMSAALALRGGASGMSPIFGVRVRRPHHRSPRC